MARAKVNSISEVLPHLEMVHFVLAQNVEMIQGGGMVAVPDTISANIGGSTGGDIRVFLQQMVHHGVMDWDIDKGYTVNGFGIEVLKAYSPTFSTSPSEAQRRIDEALMRIEITDGRSRSPVREGRHRR